MTACGHLAAEGMETPLQNTIAAMGLKSGKCKERSLSFLFLKSRK